MLARRCPQAQLAEALQQVERSVPGGALSLNLLGQMLHCAQRSDSPAVVSLLATPAAVPLAVRVPSTPAPGHAEAQREAEQSQEAAHYLMGRWRTRVAGLLSQE